MVISDGHLSRVERGLRPVSPAILAAYERALGMRITAETVAEALADEGADDRADRRQFHSRVAGILLGGPALVDHSDDLLRAADEALLPPGQVGEVDIAHVEQAAAMVRRLDLRFGGILASHIGRRLLRWALPLRTAGMSEPVRVRLHTGLGVLACWTAWAAFDAHRHDTARVLWMLALESAVTADQPDLRAHVLTDIAAGHNHHGHPADSLHLLRVADGDERTSPAIRAILHGVRAHAYATLAEPDRCLEHLKLAEDLTAAVDTDALPVWFGGWQPAHSHAMCAHAVTSLALATGDDAHLADAHDRLTRAAGELAATTRARALALVQSRLAGLCLHTGDGGGAAGWLERAAAGAVDLRSARLNHDLASLQARMEAQS
jgi:hypothetical protein